MCVYMCFYYVQVCLCVCILYIWNIYIISKARPLCLDFLILEEEIDTKVNKRRQIFLGPFIADDKILWGRRVSRFPPPSFASCSSLEINPEDTTMIFVIKLLYPKQMFSGSIFPFAAYSSLLHSFILLTHIYENTWKWHGQKEIGDIEKEFNCCY